MSDDDKYYGENEARALVGGAQLDGALSHTLKIYLVGSIPGQG